MKKFIFILLSVFCFSLSSKAQIWKKIKNKVSQTVSDRAVDAAGNTTNKAIDKTIDGTKSGNNSSSGTNSNNAASGDNNNNKTNINTSDSGPATLKSYQNYDFVPGDTILFADDFSSDQEGEFPGHWELLKGQGTVNKSQDKYVLTLLGDPVIGPRMKTKEYLGDAFTIEFDAFAIGDKPDCGYGVKVYLHESGDKNETKVINVLRYKSAATSSFHHDLTGVELSQSDKDFWNQWHHIAIAYKKPQMKVYIDQTRVLSMPDIGFEPAFLTFGGSASNDNSCPMSLSNFRIASGGNMNMVGKKLTESKIVTHGINFDIDKATIKPESMGTLNMIVNIMKSNPDVKFEIDGHTDNSGTAQHNLDLSQQRADAVKDQLIKMGIDVSRLTTKGFGDTKPISDNDTPEGKENNRRVEFVKI
jgi:outer membrane protein OmpA-like peptidoglycan-associated protein